MSKLDKVFDKHRQLFAVDREKARDDVKDLFKELVGEVIEPYGSQEMQYSQSVVNQDRARILKEIDEL